MAVKEVNLNDFAKELGAYTERQFVEVRKATALGCVKSIPSLVQASPVDTGQYASSWDVEGLSGGIKDSVVIGNFAPHSPMIEYGARPFTPPIGPLLAWAKRVLKDPSQPPGYSSEVWALARGTQRKIAAQGMRPRHILRNMIPKIMQNIRQEYEGLK